MEIDSVYCSVFSNFLIYQRSFSQLPALRIKCLLCCCRAASGSALRVNASALTNLYNCRDKYWSRKVYWKHSVVYIQWSGNDHIDVWRTVDMCWFWVFIFLIFICYIAIFICFLSQETICLQRRIPKLMVQGVKLLNWEFWWASSFPV